jgi:hypothetical protein
MTTTEPLYGTDKVIADVLRERKRQVVVEGFTRVGDDQQYAGRLSLAGACYSLYTARQLATVTHGRHPPATDPHLYWPMAPEAWKPKDPRRNLVRAAALLIAEIERIDRDHDMHPSNEHLTALIDDRLDGAAYHVGELHVHMAPGQKLTAVGDRVLIEPQPFHPGAAAHPGSDASEVAQRFPTETSTTCDDGGRVSTGTVESSPVDTCGGGE